MKKTKNIICMFLVIAMIIGSFPTNLWAAEPDSYEAALAEYLQEHYDAPEEWDVQAPYDDDLYVWTRTLTTPLGAVGFEIGFDSNPNAIIGISVQFTTPPVAALQMMHEAQH